VRKKGLDHQHPSCLADGTHLSPGERCRRGPYLACHGSAGRRRGHRGLQQLTTPRELGLSDAVGQEPIVPDVLKPPRQDVEELCGEVNYVARRAYVAIPPYYWDKLRHNS
jgi:hypothetical protein